MAFTVLVLGGTSWLGGATARQAHARGHQVTCLARGESGPVPEEVTWVRADRWRDDAYDGVREERWDAVVDVSRQPVLVRSALDALAARTGHWVFVSTCSVYADDSTPGQDESAPLHEPWGGVGGAGADHYGPAKVACEQACRQALSPDRLLVARSGLIAGYGDRSDRFGYWPARLARPGGPDRVLVPRRDTAVQVIDVEDLAQWLVTCAEDRISGAVNALGDSVSLNDVLVACEGAADARPAYLEAAGTWLAEHDVAPWSGQESLPLWLPLPEHAGFMTRTNDAATESGLRFRPLSETVAAALGWEVGVGLERDRKAGLTPQREAALLTELSTATQ